MSQLKLFREAMFVRDQDTLVFSFFTHIDPGALGNGENMWRVFIPPLITIRSDDGVCVEGKLGVWIDGDQEEPRVCLHTWR